MDDTKIIVDFGLVLAWLVELDSGGCSSIIALISLIGSMGGSTPHGRHDSRPCSPDRMRSLY